MKTSKNDTWLPMGFFAGMLLSLAWIFRKALSETWASWQTDEYSHGYLIPVVAVIFTLNHLAKGKEKSSDADQAKASWPAIAALCAGLIAHMIFEFSGIKGFQPHIFVICAIAIFGISFGMATLKSAAGPIGLLLFAVPLPKFVYYILSFNMQMLSTSLGTLVMQGLSIPVFRDGNILDLGSTKLQVAEACNGLRYFFPLVSLGYIFAYLYKAPLWKRAVVFLSTAPIAVLMNGLRIALIGVTVSFWGKSWAEGLVHDIEGWGVFAGCCLLMLAEVWLLSKCGNSASRGRFDLDSFRVPDFKKLPNIKAAAAAKPALIAIAIGLLVSATLPTVMTERLKPVALKQSLTEFPLAIEEWKGTSSTLDEQSLSVLGTSDYFIGDYRKEGVEVPVNLYILYYAFQDVTTNQAVHSPLACIPGGGWKIDGQSSKAIPISDNKTFPVNVLTISKGLDRQLVYYLYVQNGEPILDAVVARITNIRNAVVSGQTSGAMLRFVTPIGVSESMDDAQARLDSFLKSALGAIYDQIGWQPTN
ncbi:MAG: VPLPA-CTERM-specific exosortase XrtD [Bdellovibrionales bacterium]